MVTLQSLFPDLVPKPPFRPYTEEEIDGIWKNAVFTPDANVLLRLYELAETPKRSLLDELKKLAAGKRLTISHQAAHEFMQNRKGTIEQQAESYINAAKAIDASIDSHISGILRLNRPIQIVSPELGKEFSNVLSKIKQELIDKSQRVLSQIEAEKDSVIDFINKNLLSVFEPATFRTTHDDAISEAKRRFKDKKPPGYADGGRPGDYIIWEQTLVFAKNHKCPIVFITEEKKEDWWVLGKISDLEGTSRTKISQPSHPRFELLSEFLAETNHNCHLVSIETFLKRQGVSDKIVSEARASHLDNELLIKRIDHLMPSASFTFDDFSAGELFRICDKLMELVEHHKQLLKSKEPTTKTKFIEVAVGSKFRIYLETLRRILRGITTMMPRDFPNDLFYVLSDAEREVNLLLHNDIVYYPETLDKFGNFIMSLRNGAEKIMVHFN